ncbi:SAE2-domain-containing protein [Mollisia scopiformis]|uniref:SAE2-domain-containing protein n=1 Tax=Mollisia scopiformis TaxID=149040 RepID=A0A194X7C9_MOLSC|nr:SAE2-domain-containing protein [Mollisia scopiformis]KUJ16085.1 SAE2-domain-containing protein [Mollisia scopiformis]
MESWKNGREQLLEQLTTVCNQIGSNLRTELDDEKFTTISREELDLLRTNSASVGPVNEQNHRLGEQIEKYRAIAARVDGLETENKRLAAELQQHLQTRQEGLATPKIRLGPKESLNTTPAATNPPSSAARIECDETKPVAPEKYQALALKYNKLCDEYKKVKDARKTLEDAYRAEKDTGKGWNAFKEEVEKSMAKKEAKIKRLEAELQVFKHTQREIRGLETSIPTDRRPASSLPAQLAKQSSLEEVDAEIPRSSPISDQEDPLADTRGVGCGAFDVDTGIALEEEPVLPKHRENTIQVEETQYVGLEAHHTSSTEDTDPMSGSRGMDEETPELLIRRSPSPETPVVISSRSVKKRKTRHELSQQTPASKIKSEVILSSPMGLANFFSVNESLDLDDIGEKVDTPRKHRRLQQEFSRQASRGPLQSLESLTRRRSEDPDFNDTRITTKSTPIRAAGSVLQSRSTNEQILPRTSDSRGPKKRRIASDKDVETLMEDGELVTPVRGSKRTSDGGERLIDLLSKPSPPRQPISPVGEHATNQQPTWSHRPTTTSGLAREITRLPLETKDFDGRSATSSRPSSKGSAIGQLESSRPSSRGTSRTSVEPPRPVSRGAKKSLEAKTSSKASPRSKELVARASNTPTHSPPLPPLLARPLPSRRDPEGSFSPKPRLLNIQQVDSARKSKSSVASATKPRREKIANMTLTDWEKDPEQEPFRNRPIETLRLQDFKVNPEYNQGYDYAFRQVVRGNARHSLEGCTKPECCGHQFRALAEINTAKSPTASQEERDDKLLHEYMGDNAYKLRNMSIVDRNELLLQAKTREISNEHGRHRHAYARPVSPPGYWRNDFPTTQEQRADLEKVKENEKELIAERYREAMRPGGRYIFRDE